MTEKTFDYRKTIHHDGSARYVKPVSNEPLQIGDEVILRVRAHRSAPINYLFLRTTPDGEQELNPLTAVSEEGEITWWQIRVRVEMPMLHYRFLVFTEDGTYWLNNRGLVRNNPTDQEDFKILAGFHYPSWIDEAIFYQIFPDRFADGDPTNNVQNGEFIYRGELARARRWGESAGIQGLADLVTFFGGDLQGVTQKLDYLKELGVNAIYLNPIFTAYSNHRYDVVNYFEVDPHLGGDEALIELRQASEERGMRLMLDIVPNHCGVENKWFQDAVADSNCEKAEFFTFHEHPGDYATWLGVNTLPKFNYLSARLREVVYAGENSVFRYWMKPPFSIDGWRIDVANMLARQGINQLGLEVGAGIRRAVKETNPDAYLLGENFFDATHQLQGDFLDASMNYSGFSKPVWFWLGKFEVFPKGSKTPVVSDQRWPTEAFVETLQSFYAPIPWVIARQQFNLLGSHDTPRLMTVLQENMDHVRTAVALLMTYPGVANVYYGDEVGMKGDGQNNRDTMPWDESEWNTELQGYYRKLIHLRRESPALCYGGYQILDVGEDSFVFLRDSDEEQVIVCCQRGPNSRPAWSLPAAYGGIPDGSEWEEFFSGAKITAENGLLNFPNQSPGATIWRRFIR